jgi:hypothetical protein
MSCFRINLSQNSKDTITRHSQPQTLSVLLWQLPAAKSRESDTSLVSGVSITRDTFQTIRHEWKAHERQITCRGSPLISSPTMHVLACAEPITQILKLRPFHESMAACFNIKLPLSPKNGGAATISEVISERLRPPLQCASAPAHRIHLRRQRA